MFLATLKPAVQALSRRFRHFLSEVYLCRRPHPPERKFKHEMMFNLIMTLWQDAAFQCLRYGAVMSCYCPFPCWCESVRPHSSNTALNLCGWERSYPITNQLVTVGLNTESSSQTQKHSEPQSAAAGGRRSNRPSPLLPENNRSSKGWWEGWSAATCREA